MTVKEAILESLKVLNKPSNNKDVYHHIIKNNYYDFKTAKTPESTISALLGSFIRNNDIRVQRTKTDRGKFVYYLSQNELNISIDNFNEPLEEKIQTKKTYQERDLHQLLSSYLKNKNIFAKTILHEESKNSKDNHQKWIHPDMIGVEFLHLTSKVNKAFMKILNKSDTLKLTSYEIKKEINTDYELKKCYFQTVSNSSWANYGYLVALEIDLSLKEEMQRLNQSFGIGIINLKANPYESEILFQAKFKELDFRTIDKLCRVNQKYESFIEIIEKALSGEERYYKSIEKELDEFCDDYFENDSEIEKYCKKTYIPIENKGTLQ